MTNIEEQLSKMSSQRGSMKLAGTKWVQLDILPTLGKTIYSENWFESQPP